MNFYDKILVFFNLKKRSAPARENWIEYAAFFSRPSDYLLNDFNFILLGLILFACVYPIFFLIVFFAIYYRTLSKVDDLFDAHFNKGFEPQQIVCMIQHHHTQSLKEAFIAAPHQIDLLYKKKSLLYWAKYYNNLEAHKMIIDLMKERIIQKKTLLKS